MTSPEDKTYIAIDYGRKRLGVAKSDPTGLIASPLTTLEVKSDSQAVAEVSELLKEYRPRGLVVGYPVHKSGDRSETCKRIDCFIEKLVEVYPIEVFREDEMYSSQEATDIIHAHGKRVGTDKKRVDRLAAVIILERFLKDLK
jgi:putative Holliday junction resolvase